MPIHFGLIGRLSGFAHLRPGSGAVGRRDGRQNAENRGQTQAGRVACRLRREAAMSQSLRQDVRFDARGFPA